MDPNGNLWALCGDYAKLRKIGLMTDITIVCEGTRFPAHRVILAARSEVFAAMFSHKDTLEDQRKEVEINDIDEFTMERFLSFIYEATVPGDLDFEDTAHLFAAANKYQVTSLIETCAMNLRKNMGNSW